MNVNTLKIALIVAASFACNLVSAQPVPAPPPLPATQAPEKPKAKKREDAMEINKILSFQFHYTYVIPGEDLAKRFGTIHSMGAGITFKTKKNLLLSFDMAYQYGNTIKEDQILNNLTNSSGIISNTSGFSGDFAVSMRGLQSFLKVGKVFPLSVMNRNSGIFVMGGAGFYSHMINISTNRNDVPPLTESLVKGYDRLSMGPAFSETIGYYFHSKNRYANFYAGFDFVQAFTSSVRKYNYDQMAPDTGKRTDLTYGFRVCWMIPIYLNTADQDEFEYR